MVEIACQIESYLYFVEGVRVLVAKIRSLNLWRWNMNIKTLVEQILEDGKITREEQNDLNMAITEDGKVSSEEKAEIERIFNMLKEGKIKAV